MSEEGDIFTDLLSGLMPPPTKAEINEEDDVEVLVVKPTSMNELRSAKYQEENGEMVAVKRSSSPIGVGLAPPPPPLTKYTTNIFYLFQTSMCTQYALIHPDTANLCINS